MSNDSVLFGDRIDLNGLDLNQFYSDSLEFNTDLILFDDMYRNNDGKEHLHKFLMEVSDHFSNLAEETIIVQSFIQDYEDLPIHAETGDDHISFGKHPGLMASETVAVKELFGVRPSYSDTFLSKTMGNFSEQWMCLPSQTTETMKHYILTRDSEFSPVLDIPMCRILLPVSRQKALHSDTIQGKCELMGRKLSYVKRGDAQYTTMHLASLFQDITLNTLSEDSFPYLPKRLGGLDKEVPFNLNDNLINSVLQFKHRKYSALLFTIMQRAWMITQPRTGAFKSDGFINDVKKLYSGWQPWFAYYSAYAKSSSSIIPDEFRKFEIENYEDDALIDCALRRLKKEQILCSESDLVLILSVQNHFRDLISSTPYIESVRLREDEIRAYNAERSLKWFSRHFSEKHYFVLLQNYITEDCADLFSSSSLDSFNDIRKYILHERMFYREALDEVYEKGPLKVNIPLAFKGKVFSQPRSRFDFKVRDNPDLLKLEAWLRGERIELPPQELIEDDEVIRSMVLRNIDEINKIQYPTIVIETNDYRLGEKIAIEFRIRVIILSPYITKYHMTKRAIRRRDTAVQQLIELARKRVFMVGHVFVYHDYGSISASEAELEIKDFTNNLNWFKSGLYNHNYRKRSTNYDSIIKRWPSIRDILDGFSPDKFNPISRRVSKPPDKKISRSSTSVLTTSLLSRIKFLPRLKRDPDRAGTIEGSALDSDEEFEYENSNYVGPASSKN